MAEWYDQYNETKNRSKYLVHKLHKAVYSKPYRAMLWPVTINGVLHILKVYEQTRNKSLVTSCSWCQPGISW